jgi:hypothetical protein
VQQIITGDQDGTVRFWEAATPAQLALWTRQEKETQRRLAAWQKPGAGEPGFIQDWLVLAPLKLEEESGAEGWEREQLPGEAKLQPRAGQQVWVGGQQRTRKAYRAKEPVLDFNGFVGELSVDCVGYAVCYVISDVERKDLLLQVGSDDQAKVYLNGEEVYKDLRSHALNALDPVSPITLRKGTNVLVLKVVNWVLGWEACVRFVDRESNPVQGLQVRLTPE